MSSNQQIIANLKRKREQLVQLIRNLAYHSNRLIYHQAQRCKLIMDTGADITSLLTEAMNDPDVPDLFADQHSELLLRVRDAYDELPWMITSLDLDVTTKICHFGGEVWPAAIAAVVRRCFSPESPRRLRLRPAAVARRLRCGREACRREPPRWPAALASIFKANFEIVNSRSFAADAAALPRTQPTAARVLKSGTSGVWRKCSSGRGVAVDCN